jgi:uncharacterized membrane protein
VNKQIKQIFKMKNIKWAYVLNIVALFAITFLLIKRIYKFINTGEIDYIRVSVNIIFIIYISYRIFEQRKKHQ